MSGVNDNLMTTIVCPKCGGPAWKGRIPMPVVDGEPTDYAECRSVGCQHIWPLTTNGISVVVPTFNEEHNIAACIESAGGADEIVVADDGSTDDTVAIAESLGARVYRRADEFVDITRSDVIDFADRYGWSPEFTAGETMGDGRKQYDSMLAHCTHDWVLRIDADERVSWELPTVRGLMPTADQFSCDFTFHVPGSDGETREIYPITKLYRRAGAVHVGRTHTVVQRAGRCLKLPRDILQIHHWQPAGHVQRGVIRVLEYSVITENERRDRFYLGREYATHERFSHALVLLDEYIDDVEGPTFAPEIGEAYLYKAYALSRLGRGDEASAACIQAVMINPDHRDALQLMADLYSDSRKAKWQRIANAASNQDALC